GIIAMASLISIAILFINIVLICFILDEFLRESYHQRFAAWRSGGFRSTYFQFSTNVYLKTESSI
ncbi:hypothetical protein LIT63_12335, partial [Flavobacterium psychrophilum]